MATTDELKTALRETLESRGVLEQLRAQVRAEVYKALDDNKTTDDKPQLSDENLILNELIKDYLQFNGYNYTRSVFLTEARQPKEGLSTEFLAQDLSLQPPDENSVPLLYQMLAHFKGTTQPPCSKPHPPANTNPAPSSYHHGNHSSTNADETSHPPAVVIQGLK